MNDNNYPIGGYAPGNYHHHCCTCGQFFQGDKQSIQCELCAIKDKEFYDALTPEQQKRFDQMAADITKVFFENRRLEEQNNLLRDAISSNDTIIEGLEQSIKLKEEENMRLRKSLEAMKSIIEQDLIANGNNDLGNRLHIEICVGLKTNTQ